MYVSEGVGIVEGRSRRDVPLSYPPRADALGHSPVGVTPLHGGVAGTVHRPGFDGWEPVVATTGDTDLRTEARMLDYLARESDLPVPAVRSAAPDLLVLEYVDGDATHDARVERDAATHLAALHGVTSDGRGFGFPFDTLAGPVGQPNPWTDSWVDLFGDRRPGHVTDWACGW
jgi:hypothetical protein